MYEIDAKAAFDKHLFIATYKLLTEITFHIQHFFLQNDHWWTLAVGDSMLVICCIVLNIQKYLNIQIFPIAQTVAFS